MNCLKPGALPRLVRGSSISRVTNTCSFHIKRRKLFVLKMKKGEEERKEEARPRTCTQATTSTTATAATTTTTTTTSTIKTRWYINKPALCQTPTRKSSRYGSCYSFVGIKGKERNHQTCCVGEIAQEKGTRQGIYQFDRRSVSAIFRYFNQ